MVSLSSTRTLKKGVLDQMTRHTAYETYDKLRGLDRQRNPALEVSFMKHDSKALLPG